MAQTQKRKKEFSRLKSEAGALLHDQRDLVDQARRVARDARRQASSYGREEVAPRIKETYDEKVRPVVDSGISTTRAAAHLTRDTIVDDIVPLVSTALGSAIGGLEAATSPEARAAVKDVASSASKKASALGKKAGKNASKLSAAAASVKPKNSGGPGKYILIGLAVVAVAGLAYAAWQTLRADDDLWIDDDVDQADVETPEA